MVEVNPSRRAFMGAVLAGALAPAVALQAQEKPKDFQPAKRQPIFDYDALFKEQNDPEKFRAKIKADPKFDPLAIEANALAEVSNDVDSLAHFDLLEILDKVKKTTEEERAKLTSLARSLYTDTTATLKQINKDRDKESQYPGNPEGVIRARERLALTAGVKQKLLAIIDVLKKNAVEHLRPLKKPGQP